MIESENNFEIVDVANVEVLRHLELRVNFDDGVSGVVTISPTWLTGVFEVLANPENFKNVSVVNGAVTWANELDLDPFTMYAALRKESNYHIA